MPNMQYKTETDPVKKIVERITFFEIFIIFLNDIKKSTIIIVKRIIGLCIIDIKITDMKYPNKKYLSIRKQPFFLKNFISDCCIKTFNKSSKNVWYN